MSGDELVARGVTLAVGGERGHWHSLLEAKAVGVQRAALHRTLRDENSKR
jgi:hypothetical protein